MASFEYDYDGDGCVVPMSSCESPKPQGNPLPCWGRIGFRMPHISEIHVPAYLLKKKSTTPEEISYSNLSCSDNMNNSVTSSHLFENELQLRDSRNNENEEMTNCRGIVNFHLDENCKKIVNVEDKSSYNLFNVALPKKQNSRVSETENFQKAKSKKNKNQSKQNSHFATFFQKEKNMLNLSKHKYTLNLDLCSYESQNSYLNNKDNLINASGHLGDSDRSDSECSKYYEECVSSDFVAEEIQDFPAVEELLDNPVSSKMSPENPSTEIGQQFPVEYEPSIMNASSPNDIVIENVPREADREEVEHLLNSYGEIKRIVFKEAGHGLTIMLSICCDPEWMIECLNDTDAFGEFEQPLKVYQNLKMS